MDVTGELIYSVLLCTALVRLFASSECHSPNCAVHVVIICRAEAAMERLVEKYPEGYEGIHS